MSNWVIVNEYPGFELCAEYFDKFKIVDESKAINDLGLLNEFLGRKTDTLVCTAFVSRALRLKKDTKRFRVITVTDAMETLENKYNPFVSSYIAEFDCLIIAKGLSAEDLNVKIAGVITNF